MLKNPIAIFGNLSIGQRLTLGFGVLVALTLLVGLVLLGTTGNEAAAATLAEAKSNEVLTAQRLQSELLQARTNEGFFLLRWRSESFETAFNNYVLPNRDSLSRVRDAVAALRLIEAEGVESGPLPQIEQLTLDYDTQFTTLVEDLRTHGFVDTGVEGLLRADAQALEESSIITANPELLLTLLEVRRNEKDYLVRGFQSDVEDTQNYVFQLQDQVRALDIPVEQQNELVTLADSYLAQLDKLVALDQKIIGDTNNFQSVAQSISPLVNDVVEKANAEQVQTLANLRAAQQISQIVNVTQLLLAVVIGVFLAITIRRSITRPLAELTQTAVGFSQGDFERRANITTRDETGKLAEVFNTMAQELGGLITTLESRVAQRTADLSKTVEVGRLANSIKEEDELLPRLVNYIGANFELYYTQIYLLDEAGRFAVLRAGTGDVGQQLLARQHRLDTAETSLVARAVQSGLPIVVSDTQSDATHRPNPLLPDTRSEVAIPLKSGEEIIGVLDMQANRADTFNTDNAAVFEAMAGQIASAIRSAQAFDNAQAATLRAEAINEQLTSETWHNYLGQLNDGARIGYEYDLEAPRPLAPDFDPMQHMDKNSYAQSITVRGASIGNIVVKNDDERYEIAEDEQVLVQDTARLMAQALERFRALDELNRSQEEITRRAAQLETVALVSAASASILDLDLLLQSVSELTKDNFGLYHAHFYLIDDTDAILELAAGAGEAGSVMRANHHAIPLSRMDSLVATAARERTAQISNDVTQAPNFLPNPLLPETRSELALPLVVGDLVIGVMDVQANSINRFDEEDVRVMTALADQIAVAVKNARAFAEQLKTADRLREVDRLKSQFLANMSHELRTPLNSIIGYAEVLLDGIDGDLNDEAQQDVEAIHNGGKHLLTIINDILDLAKIEAGQMMMDRREIHPMTIIEDVINTCDILARNKGLELRVETLGDIPTVKGDAVRMKQIVLNLVNNAIKFTDQGSVTVQLERYNQSQLAVRIKDSGMGMTSEEMGGLFQQFHQVDGSPTRRAGGTGLGLVISRHLVHMHGGEIYVESEKEVGTIFWFTLPVYTRASQTVQAVQA